MNPECGVFNFAQTREVKSVTLHENDVSHNDMVIREYQLFSLNFSRGKVHESTFAEFLQFGFASARRCVSKCFLSPFLRLPEEWIANWNAN